MMYLKRVFALGGDDVEEDIDVHLGLSGYALLAGLVDNKFERLGPAWGNNYTCFLCYISIQAQQQARFSRQLVSKQTKLSF